MDIAVARKRINEVLKVDSINNSDSDFIATHVPFRNIIVNTNNHGQNVEINSSEEEIFYDIFENESVKDKHQLIIVEGSSGAGKSHFIRWFNAKLSMRDESEDIVLLIRRSDNTLKGTIKQLLDIDEVKQLSNKEAYERLVKANQTISEQKFKSTIYHRFIIEIENEERESSPELKIPIKNKRKKLVALLNNGFFTEKMLDNGGPIERIFNKITSSDSVVNLDSNARFEKEDLTLTVDFVDQLDASGADKKALDMAKNLEPDDDGDDSKIEEIVNYLNSFVESVIQSSAGIEPGDFQQIFKEIRQELKRQGKNLILLIEDITSFTGINKELLNALITEHTGLNEADNLCRLISVVGTTGEYYREFRNNYKDRITKQITINDGVISENSDDLIQFAAKYLNAISLEDSVLRKWVKEGGNNSDMPVHSDILGTSWGYYDFNGKMMSLFPFNRSAIINLYSAMPGHKTPRYILQNIVGKAVNEIIFSKEMFPRFCAEWRTNLPETVENRISNIVGSLDIPNKSEYRNRLLKFIGFWGQKNIELTADDCIGGINSKIYIELGFGKFVEYIKQTTAVKVPKKSAVSDKSTVKKETAEIIQEPVEDIIPVIKVDPEFERRQSEYDSFKNDVIAWHQDKEKLINFQTVREAICEFIFESINWQQEGVSFLSRKKVKDSSIKMISFERQDQGQDKSLVMLNDNEETYKLLLCFGKWKYLGKKTWNFSDSASAVYIATSWLERNKSRFIEVVRGTKDESVPDYVKAAMIVQIYKLILNGNFGKKHISDFNSSMILNENTAQNSSIANGKGHTNDWRSLLQLIYDDKLNEDCYNDSVKYFNLVQGNAINSNIFVLNYTAFKKALKDLKSYEFKEFVDFKDTTDGKIKGKRENIEFCNKIISKTEKVVKEELIRARKMFEEIYPYFGFDEDDEIEPEDLNDMIEDIKRFYECALSSGVNLSCSSNIISVLDKLKKSSKMYSVALSKLQDVYDDYSDIDTLIAFSDDPIGKVIPILEIFRSASKDIERVISQKSNELEQLKKKGFWEDNVDPRFEQRSDSFTELFNQFKEV